MEAAESQASVEFLAGEYRCGCGLEPFSPYCMCGADVSALRLGMAVIAAVHHDDGEDGCSCHRPAVLCGYLGLAQVCAVSPRPRAPA